MARLKTDDTEPIPVDDAELPKQGKVVDERWFVEEYFPARVDQISGMLVGESWNRNYSEVFTSEKDANSWIAKHAPDYEGGKFRKVHEVQREVTILQWMPA
jgi:hypothetical protein